jgi:hypothetical protein
MERQQHRDGDDAIARMDHFEYDLNRIDAMLLQGASSGEAAAAGARQQPSMVPRRHVGLIDDNGFPSVAGDVRRSPNQIRGMLRGFERFVDLLERRPINASFQAVHFKYVLFEPEFWTWFRDDDVERLFSEALPALLPTLEMLRFNICDLPADPLNSLLRHVSSARDTSSLTDLIIADCYVDPRPCAPLVAEVIRSNGPIERLVFNPAPRMDKESCQLIYSSLSSNTHLRRLEVGVEELYEDGPALPSDLSSASSALRHLRIDVERWTEDGKASLAQQLKANTTLEVVHVVFENDDGAAPSLPHRPWVEMLEAHNYTLLALSEESVHAQQAPIEDATIAACLRRNARIHQALAAQHPKYRVACSALLPLTLELVSGLPLLLYRFVRGGDMDALVGHLLVRAAAASAAARSSSNKRIRTE